MKWKCPNCGNDLSEDDAMKGCCCSCKKIFEIPIKVEEIIATPFSPIKETLNSKPTSSLLPIPLPPTRPLAPAEYYTVGAIVSLATGLVFLAISLWPPGNELIWLHLFIAACILLPAIIRFNNIQRLRYWYYEIQCTNCGYVGDAIPADFFGFLRGGNLICKSCGYGYVAYLGWKRR